MKQNLIICLDIFTSEPSCGNPCSDLSQVDDLSERQMQKIAVETNQSMTAFVLCFDTADLKVRYFTPHIEVPFAGHPTIATAIMLVQEGKFSGRQPTIMIDFELSIGVLPVEIKMDSAGRTYEAIMTRQRPSFGAEIAKEELMKCLNQCP